MKRITIKEIAKQAGVSIGTVDRVLHNRGQVSEKTRRLVKDIADKGNYRANHIARGLRMKQEFRVAILLPNDNEYWNKINEGIAAETEELAGIGMTATSFDFDRHDPSSYTQQAQLMLKSKPDAVIMAPILELESRKICEELNSHSIPYLFVDSRLRETNPVAFIGQNSERAGSLAAKLLCMGLPTGSKVYVVYVDDFDSLNKTIDERVIGWKQYLKEEKNNSFECRELRTDKKFKALIDEAQQLSLKGEPMHIFVPNSRSHEVAEALKSISIDTRILGFDLIQSNRKALESEKVDFIIDQNPEKQGSDAIKSFYKLNVVQEPISDIDIPLTVYLKENLP